MHILYRIKAFLCVVVKVWGFMFSLFHKPTHNVKFLVFMSSK